MTRHDLIQLEATLPPYKAGRDRRVQFADDGTILYLEREGDWFEPPREINGYQRDPNDEFRFLPLWPQCVLRVGLAVRYARCGCIEIIMRCNNLKSPHLADRVKWEQCRDCPRPG
jgi:hypothetical protein